jgi:hypothetical protein
VSGVGLTGPVPLSRATSRTWTARGPLRNVVVAQAEGTANLTSLYAGPVAREARGPFVPGRVSYPISLEALQIHAVASDSALAALTVILDLGEQREIARLELYGNLLLPPVTEHGRPIHNFGLPRGLGIALAEEFRSDVDLHNRFSFLVWQSEHGQPWHVRYHTQDLRALWGWTPIHLPPAFGRYLMLHFWDLPLIYPDGSQQPAPGVDIQRLVLYPCLQDVDHRPQVEFAPIAAWQTKFHGSRFWSNAGVTAPQPASHQSVYQTSLGEPLLPSVLAGVGVEQPGAAAIPLFSSDRVSPGTDRVSLVVQATSDEIPMVAGVGLLFEPPASFKQPGTLPDYRIAVYCTNDAEAAWSSAPDHPSWRLVLAPRLVRASLFSTTAGERLMFDDPRWARYLRLSVEVLPTPGVAAADARFVLGGLSLLRSRDYVLAPEEGQDIRAEYIVVRLRGANLFADYARFDGSSGAGLTLEWRQNGGSFTTLHAFRTLLDLLENAQTRTFYNQRYVDKPVQVIREHVESNFGSMMVAGAETSTDTTATVLAEFGNRQVTETGTVVEQTDTPHAGINGKPFNALPQGSEPGGALGWVMTKRKYGTGATPAFNFAPLPAPNGDPGTVQAGVQAVRNNLDALRDGLEATGLPGSVALGVAGGWSGGAGGWFNFNAGATLSASVQLGGGVTRTLVSGKQGSAATTETRTVESSNRHKLAAMQYSLNQQGGLSTDDRVTTRVDESAEQRRPGVAVQYGGRTEDLLLAAIPVNLLLRGPELSSSPLAPAAARDVLRVRIDHLPPGVSLDVEFRGAILPQERITA